MVPTQSLSLPLMETSVLVVVVVAAVVVVDVVVEARPAV
jgi:hypothetical protein